MEQFGQEVLPNWSSKRATDKELRADGNIYAGAVPGCFIIELLAQLAHQLAP
jgi:hypothetical protein